MDIHSLSLAEIHQVNPAFGAAGHAFYPQSHCILGSGRHIIIYFRIENMAQAALSSMLVSLTWIGESIPGLSWTPPL